MENSELKNVIIIGAPRSGTNILRDVLTSFDGIGTWPCDEINYIWRHGNIRFPSDELLEYHATPKVAAYIKHQFDIMHRSQNSPVLIEKTCANCLRIPFINKIFPKAKYIYIYRNGIDAAASAQLKWTAELNLAYILKKVRFVPKADFAYYGLRYLGSRLYRLFYAQKYLPSWGPKFYDMDEVLKNYSLIEACAVQWQRCVESAETAFSLIPSENIFRLSYEDFVHNPSDQTSLILGFIGCKYSAAQISNNIGAVSSISVGKGKRSLSPQVLTKIEALIYPSLAKYGYV